MKFGAVTACPTGIAHTYMAAEALEQAAKAAGDAIRVETQGSAGSTPVPPAELQAADAVVFAADVAVQDRDRFAGKPIVEATVKEAINNATGLLDRARSAAGKQIAETSREDETTPPGGEVEPELATKVSAGAGLGTQLRQWLMTGVSYVIPFVAAGGVLIALGYAIGGYQISTAPDVTQQFDPLSITSWAALAYTIGNAAFAFLVPVLAGFIAFAMADRPAIAPGFVGGAAAVVVHAGFLGGLVAGLLAGAVVMALRRIKVPRAMAGIMPVVVLPLIGSVVTGGLMLVALGRPIAVAQAGLTAWLSGLQGVSAALLGALLGAMIAFDMGGPVNKVAYSFAVGGLATATPASLQIMAAVMGAGMVPPLALALAANVQGRLFSPAERQNARPAWLLGASFITEGAIPFAAADPLRVIPSIMAGSATTGALSMIFGATLRAPHGGVFVLPLVGHPLLFIVALLAGVLVAAAAVIAAKHIGHPVQAWTARGESAIAA